VDLTRTILRTARVVQAEDFDDAIKNCEIVLEREPENAIALHALGVLMNRSGNHQRAVTLLEQATISRSSDPSCHIDLAEGYRNLSAYRDAVGCCLTGLRLYPDYPEGWNTLGLTFRGAGDMEGALEHFLRAISCREDFYPAHMNAGLVLQELGSVDRAILHFRRAVELSPDYYPARTSLGRALLVHAQTEDALAHLEAAARLNPDLGVAHQDLGDALRLLGRTGEARACYLKAVRLDPELTLSYLHIGMTLRLEASLGDALKWYKLAVEMGPNNPYLWGELADLHHKRDEPDEAVLCRRRVLDLSPGDPIDARINLGWALQEDGRPEEALEQYLIARSYQPASASVHFALGGVYEEQGNMTDAEAALREAIRLQPRFPAVYARLATLLRGKLLDDDLRVIEGLLSDPGVRRQTRARLLFALAHVLDARLDYPLAASCLREGNALTLESRHAEGVIYRPDDHERFIGRLIATFDGEFFRRVAGMGLETRRPIFIVGLPRSGTTLVEQILASHRQVYGVGERLFARRAFEKLPAVVRSGNAPMDCVTSLDEYSLKLLAGEHLGKLNALDSGRFDRIVDKMPDNYMYIGLIAAMFPNAAFIHCRRDVRDVAVSCWMSDFRSVRWANDPSHIGSRFRQYRRLVDHWADVFPAPLFEVNYEETVADLEAVARRLLDACGLEWDPACLDFHQTRRVVRTASLTQVRQPIYKSSVERWRNYEDDLADLFSMLAELNSQTG